MWICPKCRTEVDSSFEVCWSCGTTADGVEDPSFLTADDTPRIEEPGAGLSAKADSTLDRDEFSPALELVECYRPRDSAEAMFLIDRLAEQGIPAVANGTHMGNTEYVLPLFSPRIEVRPVDFEKARSLVSEFERRRRERGAVGEAF